MEWILITKGCFQVQVGSRSRELFAGEAAFVNRRQMHAAYPAAEGSELYAIVYNEALLKGMQDSTEAQYIRPLLAGEVRLPAFYGKDTEAAGALQACLESSLRAFLHKNPAFELLLKGGLLSALGVAFQLAEQMPLPKRAEHPDKGIHHLLVHLGSHFGQPITVEEAARMCCLTPNYFCFLFKKTTGKTLIEYLHMLRIHEASRLLQLRRYSVQEIADRVGFSNSTYFGRVFKELTGITPSQYMARFPLRGDIR